MFPPGRPTGTKAETIIKRHLPPPEDATTIKPHCYVQQGRNKSHFRFRQKFCCPPAYLTYPLPKEGITVTDSWGISPLSAPPGTPARGQLLYSIRLHHSRSCRICKASIFAFPILTQRVYREMFSRRGRFPGLFFPLPPGNARSVGATG